MAGTEGGIKSKQLQVKSKFPMGTISDEVPKGESTGDNSNMQETRLVPEFHVPIHSFQNMKTMSIFGGNQSSLRKKNAAIIWLLFRSAPLPLCMSVYSECLCNATRT